jgi:hypothetical protein
MPVQGAKRGHDQAGKRARGAHGDDIPPFHTGLAQHPDDRPGKGRINGRPLGLQLAQRGRDGRGFQADKTGSIEVRTSVDGNFRPFPAVPYSLDGAGHEARGVGDELLFFDGVGLPGCDVPKDHK